MKDPIVLRVSESATRLDLYIVAHQPDLSRSVVQRLIKNDLVLVNDKPTKASYYPVPGDVIKVELPSRSTSLPAAEDIPLQIVFEDQALLVINKPPGLVVHPGPGHPSGTLVNALLAHRPEIVNADLDPQRPGIIHRLDRDTSGLLVVAANRAAQSALQAQFKSRDVQKTYLALLYGRLSPAEAAIEAPIGRDPKDRKRMKVLRQGGRYARTEYAVREHLPGATFAEVRLLTGRTHQLRVHFASIGHAVVGDRIYGPRQQRIAAPRQFLHAFSLQLTHPVTQETLQFSASLPKDLEAVLRALRSRA